jgi:hypothetical protein
MELALAPIIFALIEAEGLVGLVASIVVSVVVVVYGVKIVMRVIRHV